MPFYDEVLDRAIDVFGANEKAIEWLEKASATLDATPKDLCATRQGADQVLRHLHNIELALDTD